MGDAVEDFRDFLVVDGCGADLDRAILRQGYAGLIAFFLLVTVKNGK